MNKALANLATRLDVVERAGDTESRLIALEERVQAAGVIMQGEG